jgi:hypothetical protein
MGAEAIASPLTLLMAAVIVLAASAMHYGPSNANPVLNPKRLGLGYLGVAVAVAVVAGISAYIPIDEAVSKWHVSPDNYWSVLASSYIVLFILMLCVALVGVACVGVPIVFALGRRGWATVPTIMIASVPISTLAAVMWSAGDYVPFMHLQDRWSYVVSQHLLCSLSFSVAAGLPWRRGT